jgi:hypothetical protein
MRYWILQKRHKDFDPEHRKGLDARAEDKEHDIGSNEAQTSLMKWNKCTIDLKDSFSSGILHIPPGVEALN